MHDQGGRQAASLRAFSERTRLYCYTESQETPTQLSWWHFHSQCAPCPLSAAKSSRDVQLLFTYRKCVRPADQRYLHRQLIHPPALQRKRFAVREGQHFPPNILQGSLRIKDQTGETTGGSCRRGQQKEAAYRPAKVPSQRTVSWNTQAKVVACLESRKRTWRFACTLLWPDICSSAHTRSTVHKRRLRLCSAAV